jgi:hypothetical protein
LSAFLHRINTYFAAIFSKKRFYLLILFLGVLSVAGELINGYAGGNRFVDDAYYYILTARNFVDTGIFSFDRINPTNGFHPLWMRILVLMYYAIGTDIPLDQQIFHVKLIEGALFILAIGASLLFSFQQAEKNRAISTAYLGIALVLVYPYTNHLFLVGMESTLSVFLFILLLNAWQRERLTQLAFLLPLLFLARLETLFFIVIPLLFIFFLQRRISTVRKLLVSLPTVLVSVGYLGYTFLQTGYYKPISGLLKSSFPIPHPQWTYFLDPIWYGASTGKFYFVFLAPNLLLFLFLHTGLFVASILIKGFYRENLRLKLTLFLFALLLLANLLFFQKWNKGIEWWYWALPAIITGGLTGLTTGSFFPESRFRGTANSVLVGLLSIFAIFYLISLPASLRKIANQDPLYDFIIQKLPEAAILGATDAGDIAFWTGKRIVNLDGLINNVELQEAILDKKLRNYLRKKKVGYLLASTATRKADYLKRPDEPMYTYMKDTAAFNGNPDYQLEYYIYSYLFNCYSDTLMLRQDQELYRTEAVDYGYADYRILLFDLKRNMSSDPELIGSEQP